MVDNKTIGLRLQDDDENALDELFSAYYESLCKYAYTLIEDISDSEDVVQHCFIRLWEKRSEASTIQSFKAFLFKSVYNKCLHYLEHQKIKRKHQSEVSLELKQIYLSDFENTYHQEQIDNIHEAIKLLPEKNQEVFKLRFIDGLSTKEVGEKLGITPRTVETHVSKALKIIRDNLGTSLIIYIYYNFLKLNTWF